ncbi:MAG: hypothetical protein AB7T06_36090 [Kofleriaceae bacterium]
MNRITKLVAAGAGIAAASYATYVATTWTRYGRPRRGKAGAQDALLDHFMAEYDVVERHAIDVDAPPDVTFSTAKAMELGKSRIVDAIFRARALILRSAPDPVERPKGFLALVMSLGWGVLAEDTHEIVLGAVTKPWQANPTFRAVSPDEFATFAEPDYVKIAWTLRADRRPDGGSIFRTETRAVATDEGARAKFRLYWALLSPGIILIREAMLPQLKKIAERDWRIEGDDIVPDARTQLTHATLIDAPPKDVWPWLVQMGGQRAGWYSWDLLDNGGKRSATRIIPELQTVAVGDVLPARPSGGEGFEVLRVVPERALVLRGMSDAWPGTWAFVLEPIGTKTRLVARYRAALPPRSTASIMLPLISAVHAFMERKQLRTIKHHAEQLHGN